VIDSLQLTAKHQSRNAGELQQGDNVINAGSAPTTEAKRRIQTGGSQPKPYIRTCSSRADLRRRAGTLKRRWVTDGDAITLVASRPNGSIPSRVESGRNPRPGARARCESGARRATPPSGLHDACPTGQMDVLSPAAARPPDRGPMAAVTT